MRESQQRIGAVVMAAGAGRRMGHVPKGLLRRGGEPLLLRQIRLLAEAGVDEAVVVLGHHAERLEPVLRQAGSAPRGMALRWVANPAPDEGPGASLRCGLAALPDGLTTLLVMLADQPLLELQDVQAMLAAWRARAAGVELAVPQHAGQPGHPIVFGPLVRGQVLRAQGGAGVREWRRAHGDQVLLVPLSHARCTTDVDTPDDVQRLGRDFGVWLE
ncbi:nucleotidyltransferase family protein [Alicycliphilus denitrificans]|uniref:4-diphosphocytidyl-2C-methyl-D-erythritol synthase n=2 Tax=Alicycliphilus denitrificans TaxID=179636 RepID=F4GAG2_ALIDK|nr:nucleotidyltransferase family protein [Alicycliphilus denitrificans]ADU99722.1 molybdenum cofactor cytidylyltransferase [Alicycliphilus denitrificans BC]AEB84601.1 4-diphosphocytidyl-2C-methyl-D-erythritol synthase [Alicycliphilus denitrificans K601]QKD44440.1 nucleotidyltransferase family protein [Alicycliphilus denitrificans]GAO23622.1 4-diphosphocytidyl-2C-methyl-D-erythritol synthase [Alicycliphilus sp. B1]